MAGWMYIISIGCIAVVSGNVDIIQPNLGAIFEFDADMVLSSDKYNLAFSIPVAKIPEMADSYDPCHNEENSEGKHIFCVTYNNTVQSLVRHYKIMNKQAKEHIKWYNSLLPIYVHDRDSPDLSRSKRGVFDFVGEISKSLFGTCTMDDLQRVYAVIKALKSEVNSSVVRTVHMSKMFQTYVSTTNLRVDNVVEALNTSFKEIKVMKDKVHRWFKNYTQKFNTLVRYQRASIHFQNLIFSNLLSNLHHIQILDRFLESQIRGLMALLRGRLPVELVSPETLGGALDQVSTWLRARFPNFRISDRVLAHYYANAKTKSLLADDRI